MALRRPASLATVGLHFTWLIFGSVSSEALGAEALTASCIACSSLEGRERYSCALLSDAGWQRLRTSVSSRCHAGLTVDIPQPGVPSGVQSPTGRPPLASPGQPPPPQRSASERALQPGSATSTPGKAPGPTAGAAGAAVGSKGMPIKGDRGRFKVYEVRSCHQCFLYVDSIPRSIPA